MRVVPKSSPVGFHPDDLLIAARTALIAEGVAAVLIAATLIVWF